ncbi:hypothetical protein L6164_007521 [Bauhinia variegata]|uniref:Uncharacterized protein n=1 Tax=Bauhinia variegata TaxID=167791 RepID=A0ACB9PE18_BAUVA|nr:hypothetical protein L6164_007521 [Bauhinia variegata]
MTGTLLQPCHLLLRPSSSFTVGMDALDIEKWSFASDRTLASKNYFQCQKTHIACPTAWNYAATEWVLCGRR